jgi:hypothetical protein
LGVEAAPALVAFAAEAGPFAALSGDHVGAAALASRQRRYACRSRASATWLG